MEHKGYYSLVQFLPDISRLEAVNIGIVLYVDSGRTYIRLLKTNTRIKQFFGKQDWLHIDYLKTALQNRLAREHFSSAEEFALFAAKRANLIQMSAPRPISIEESDAAIDDLFHELVATQPLHRRKRVDVQLGERLQLAGVRQLVKHGVKVNFPFFDEPFRAPYGYQNGRFNLLTAVHFNTDLRELISKVAEKAVEGKVLYENPDPSHGPLTLNVIGTFPEELNQSSRQFIESLLRDNFVKLYDFDHLDHLVNDIKGAATVHSND